MAHSHDRTLLASLGFADPDKREPRHDIACAYVSRSEVAAKIVKLFGSDLARPTARVEVPISKGIGQYKTTVGFIDVQIDSPPTNGPPRIYVEVKIARCAAGDVVRQINLYRQYTEARTPWVLVTAFNPSFTDLDLFRTANICHVLLGPDFVAWCSSRAQSRLTPSVEI